MTGIDISRITSDPDSAAALANLDPEKLNAFLALVNAKNIHEILVQIAGQGLNPPANYNPPPGGGHPGLDIHYRSPEPAPAVEDVARTYSLAEVVRACALSAGISISAAALVLIPIFVPAIAAAIATGAILVAFVTTVKIDRDIQKKAKLARARQRELAR